MNCVLQHQRKFSLRGIMTWLCKVLGSWRCWICTSRTSQAIDWGCWVPVLSSHPVWALVLMWLHNELFQRSDESSCYENSHYFLARSAFWTSKARNMQPGIRGKGLVWLALEALSEAAFTCQWQNSWEEGWRTKPFGCIFSEICCFQEEVTQKAMVRGSFCTFAH